MSYHYTYKYLDINSSYRNRTLYPNPTDFVMNVNTTGNYTDSILAKDPVVEGFPIESSTTQVSLTATNITLNAGASIIDNYYVDQFIDIGGEYRKVINYVGASKVATVVSAFSAIPAAGTNYSITGATPIVNRDNLVAGSTQTDINLGALASNIDRAYDGQYIYFITGPNAGLINQISNYNGTTKVAKLSKTLPNIPGAADVYNILAFTKDNSYPLIYPGTLGFGQACWYSIDLLYLTIPNRSIRSGYGGTFKNYPFLYVQLYNEGNSHTSQTMYSNNPNAKMALFKVPIGLNLVSETFFTLKDAKMNQTVQLKFDQPLHFKIYFPDGEPIILAETDYQPPKAPNQLLQFSATFAFKRIEP